MKTVQEMAAECAYITTDQRGRVTYELDLYGMERFAALVRAQALEEAAEVCDAASKRAESMRSSSADLIDAFLGHHAVATAQAANAIRALKASVPPDQETPKGV